MPAFPPPISLSLCCKLSFPHFLSNNNQCHHQNSRKASQLTSHKSAGCWVQLSKTNDRDGLPAKETFWFIVFLVVCRHAGILPCGFKPSINTESWYDLVRVALPIFALKVTGGNATHSGNKSNVLLYLKSLCSTFDCSQLVEEDGGCFFHGVTVTHHWMTCPKRVKRGILCVVSPAGWHMGLKKSKWIPDLLSRSLRKQAGLSGWLSLLPPRCSVEGSQSEGTAGWAGSLWMYGYI